MRTHLAIFFADRGDVAVLKARDKIAQPDGLALLAIRSNERRKSRKRAHLANAGLSKTVGLMSKNNRSARAFYISAYI